MAFDSFLKIDGVEGESRDAKHKNEIDVLSWSWGESQGGTLAPAGGGGGAGKVSFQDFHFVSRTQKSSPKLFLACASGQHIKEAVLICRKAGEAPVEYLKITMSDILVSSFQQSGASDGGEATPLEEISMNFAKFSIAYTEQDEKGSPRGTTSASWDLKTNKGGESAVVQPPPPPTEQP